MHRIVAAFSFIVAAMWIVITIAEATGDGSPWIVIAAGALALAFLFAGYRLLRHPPERFRR